MATSRDDTFFSPPFLHSPTSSHSGCRSCGADDPSSSDPSSYASTVSSALDASRDAKIATPSAAAGSRGSYSLVKVRSSMGEERWILNVVGGVVAVAVAPSPAASLGTTLTTDTSRRFDEGAEESPPVRALSAFLMDFISSSHSITSERDFSIASRALSVMVAWLVSSFVVWGPSIGFGGFGGGVFSAGKSGIFWR